MSSVEIPIMSYANMRNEFTFYALLDIRAMNVYGGLKKKYTDARFKKTVLRQKYHAAYKKAYGSREFKSSYMTTVETKNSGNIWTTHVLNSSKLYIPEVLKINSEEIQRIGLNKFYDEEYDKNKAYQYLQHDVLGLLEVIDKFSQTIYDISLVDRTYINKQCKESS